ncbi:unnamed protein product [Amoebophrya sp. A120]|nr:unnamed protein product [Amoebophrya sp. A120]|eukprot:GSA120T00001205001.1
MSSSSSSSLRSDVDNRSTLSPHTTTTSLFSCCAQWFRLQGDPFYTKISNTLKKGRAITLNDLPPLAREDAFGDTSEIEPRPGTSSSKARPATDKQSGNGNDVDAGNEEQPQQHQATPGQHPPSPPRRFREEVFHREKGHLLFGALLQLTEVCWRLSIPLAIYALLHSIRKGDREDALFFPSGVGRNGEDAAAQLSPISELVAHVENDLGQHGTSEDEHLQAHTSTPGAEFLADNSNTIPPWSSSTSPW